MKIKAFLFLIMVIISGCQTVKLTETEKNYLLNDSGNDKLYLIELIKKQQLEGKLGEMPTMIVNEEPIFYYYRLDNQPANIRKKDIKSIEIIDSEKCIQLYGAACKYGLITIKTIGPQQLLP